jgi:hypothetical protein
MAPCALLQRYMDWLPDMDSNMHSRLRRIGSPGYSDVLDQYRVPRQAALARNRGAISEMLKDVS